MALICLVLAVIFASFSSAAYLADAAHGMLDGTTVVLLTALKTLVSLEALLPTALYLGIIVGLGRLYSDTEMTALLASGVSEMQILRHVAWLVVLVAMLVASLTLQVRPWAYHMAYQLEARAVAELDIDKLEGGRFYRLGQTDNVLFAAHIDREQDTLRDVLFRNVPAGGTQIIRAREASLGMTEAGVPVMIFRDGHAYHLDNKNTGTDLILRFETLSLPLHGFEDNGTGYKRKAQPLAKLAASEQPGDLAEYQWRLSMPLTTVILGLLAVPLSRSRPRQGRFARLFVAILMFALYYNLLSVARTWVDQAKVEALPGIWWAHAVPAVILLVLLAMPYLRFRPPSRRAVARARTP